MARAVLALTLGAGFAAGGAELAGASHPATSTVSPAAAARVTKLLVIVEENHSLTQMRAGMPYTAQLAATYGYATHYDALAHPSLPNYLAIAGGRTFGVGDDAGPDAHRLPGRSVFGQALANGRTATTYAESMTTPCALDDGNRYVVRHNPWAYFPADAAGCAAHDLSTDSLATDAAAGTLPRVGMVIPDLDHDAHDGTLAVADAWVESVLEPVFAGPDWQSGHLAIVLTADEDDRAHGNRVLTVVMHPSQRHHVVTTPLDHYSLTRLYDEVAGLPYLHRARTAPSMAAAFGLRVPARRD